MYGRSTHATPVTRHVPLLLTVLVSAAIHVLLLAAGWALIRTNHEISQDTGALTVTLEPTVPAATAPLVAAAVPVSPEAPEAFETHDSPEATPPVTSTEQVVTTTAADTLSAPVNPVPAPASENQTSLTAPSAHESPPVEPIEPRPTAVRMLNPHEHRYVQQVLAQFADSDSVALNQTGDTIVLPDGAQLAVDVRAVTAPGLTDLARYEVTLTQRRDGQLLSTRAILRERAFSWYAKFIHRWDNDVVLANDQVIGRFHSNSPVNFSTDRRQQPVFSGPVSLADYQAISRRLRSSGMFQQGVHTGTGHISMPDAVAPAVFTLAAQSLDVHRFDEDTRLAFLAGGGFGWSQAGSRSGIIRPAAGNAMLIIAGDDAVLELSGVISGVVSVFAPRRLSIIGNLTYAEDASRGDDHQHLLTLISNGIIEVASPAQTGPGDLEIQAAVFARQRFSVRRFSSRPQGELIIRGTLVAGSVSATEPRYTTRIEYDPRFESVRPPAFPTTGVFDIADWDGQWRITDAPDDSPAIDPGMIRPLAVE